jgi:hypothetical protein
MAYDPSMRLQLMLINRIDPELTGAPELKERIARASSSES